MSSVKVAVVGCSHGELDKIYAALQNYKEEKGLQIDLLVCCGDFQAVRNRSDMKCMAIPAKYQHMQTFHKYYSGASVAPVLTVFVGGNHEASNYLAELPFGGWVAPNIYYMGYANAVQFRGLRIGGLSGIFRGRQYNLNHFECPPYSEDTKRTAYYLRSVDVFRLKQLKPTGDEGYSRLDICVSHDWPRGIHEHGNQQELFRRKPFFVEEAQRGQLGNPATMQLLQELRPRYWFSAHLHVKFPAIVQHGDETNTRFLALDKCLPNRHWLQILDIPVTNEQSKQFEGLCYDPMWLAVLRNTNELTKIENGSQYMPGPGGPAGERIDFRPSAAEIDEVLAILGDDWSIPANFEKTGECHFEGAKRKGVDQSLYFRNPQTTTFCDRFGVKDLNEMLAARYSDRMGVPTPGNDPLPQDVAPPPIPLPNPDEISLDDDDDEDSCCRNEYNQLSEDNKLSDGGSELADFLPPPIKKLREDEEGKEEKVEKMDQIEGEASAAMMKFKRRNRVNYEQEEEKEEETETGWE